MGQSKRQDGFLTSTGVGLEYQPPVSFPPPGVRSTASDPLPPFLQKSKKVSAFDEVVNAFETTNGDAYKGKHPRGVLSQPSYPLPPPHWTVHYNKEFEENFRNRQLKSPRNIQNRQSEMKAAYRGESGLPSLSEFHAGPQPFSLEDHHNSGPSQSIVASTENRALSGKPYYIRDKGVLALNDIYASTTTRDFRAFTAKELGSYPKKDVLTYWEAENYPKAWGHGLKENPLRRDAKPTLRPPPPMQDTSRFPNVTKVPRIPPAAKPVPNRGLKTLAQESYNWPMEAKKCDHVYSSMERPWNVPRQGAANMIMSVPKMYKTEYKTYGSGQLVIV
ncbi:uncharacterized protein LOC128470312 [Spea bombifrons]|uniref:uncharacterized protein LOC128470312 n=1 Tax=Spea bombifrons TaxID=233779 RepID=UPI00234A0D78|nr:uncharacterized protein LOC128470312 [Spea bombifrons]